MNINMIKTDNINL